MSIHQLSVFLENKPGRLSAVCKDLADAGISILACCLADTHRYGVFRLIVRQWEAGRDVLVRDGCIVTVTEVTVLEVPDRPGGLEGVLEVIERIGINLEYMYAVVARPDHAAMVAFCFEDPPAAVTALQAEGIAIVDRLPGDGSHET